MPVLRTSLGVEGFAGCGRPPLRPAPPRPPLRPGTPSSGPAPARGHRSLLPPLMGPPPRPRVGAAEMPPLPPLGVSGCGGCLLMATVGWHSARHVLPRLPPGRRQEAGGLVRSMVPSPHQAQIGQPGRMAAVYSTPPSPPRSLNRQTQVREACVGGGGEGGGGGRGGAPRRTNSTTTRRPPSSSPSPSSGPPPPPGGARPPPSSAASTSAAIDMAPPPLPPYLWP